MTSSNTSVPAHPDNKICREVSNPILNTLLGGDPFFLNATRVKLGTNSPTRTAQTSAMTSNANRRSERSSCTIRVLNHATPMNCEALNATRGNNF